MSQPTCDADIQALVVLLSGLTVITLIICLSVVICTILNNHHEKD